MPRSPEQFDDIRKQKKELIMETALELFAEKGFHPTSMSMIAQRAGISKGLTYNYFKSKKELLDELISHGFNTIYGNLDFNRDGVLNEEEFVYFIHKNFQLLRENLRHWKLFFSLLLQSEISDYFTNEYQQFAEPMFKLFLDFIINRGSTDPEGDLMAIASMLEGAFLYVVAAPDIFPIDKLEEKIIKACFKIIDK